MRTAADGGSLSSAPNQSNCTLRLPGAGTDLSDETGAIADLNSFLAHLRVLRDSYHAPQSGLMRYDQRTSGLFHRVKSGFREPPRVALLRKPRAVLLAVGQGRKI